MSQLGISRQSIIDALHDKKSRRPTPGRVKVGEEFIVDQSDGHVHAR